MRTYYLLFILLLVTCFTFGQHTLPILKTNSEVISIKDGMELKKDYWTISAEIKLDVYTADKINQSKVITFYSDIDSIAFPLNPRSTHDFIILLNGTDSCFTRIESGIMFIPDPTAKPTHDTIPFTLTKFNNISIPVLLNGVDTLNLMFHTGVSGVSLTKKATQTTSSLQLNNSEILQTWGGEASSRYCVNNSLQIGDFGWEKITIFESEHSGRLTDGKFGPNLWEDMVLELDFDKRLLIVHSQLPEMEDGFEKLPLIFRESAMFIEGEIQIGEEAYSNNFLIHTGFSGALLLDDEFVNQHKIGEKLPTLSESQLKDSFGNILKTKKVNLPGLSFGKSQFSEVPVEFFDGAIGRQKMSVVGGSILKRFNLVFDLQNAFLYLQPNGLSDMRFVDSPPANSN